MKKTFIAALAFLALVSCGNKNENTEATDPTTPETETPAPEVNADELVAPKGDYVFVDVAHVIGESNIMKTEGKALEEKGKKLEKKFANSEKNIQTELQQLNEKYQKGLITTLDAQAKQEELQKRMISLQKQAEKEMPQFQEEMVVLNNRINDLLLRAVQDINSDKKYKMVVNSASLLDYDKSLDITSLVLAKVNEMYKAEKGDTTAKKK